MHEATLTVELRTKTGKGEARRLRRAGRIPAVLYGSGRETKTVSVSARDFYRVYQQVGHHGLVQLQVVNGGAQTETVLIKEVQVDPIGGDYVHVDFYAVALDREIETTVPVVLLGEEQRRDDAVVQQLLHEVDIRCLPVNIPDAIVVDVASLAIGDVITVGQLQPPEGVVILDDPETTVVAITPPEREEPASEAEAPAEEQGAEA